MRDPRPILTRAAAMVMLSGLLAATVGAETIPGGPVSGTWTAAGSPYLIAGEIDVPVDQTLIIDPGVEVIFQGWYKFNVHGRLLAVGTEADSIRIHAEVPGTGWHSLRFLDTATAGQLASELAYCRIEDGRSTGSCPDNTGAGLYMNRAKTTVRHCLITGNTSVFGSGSWGGGGVALEYCDEVAITNCRIEDNETGGDGGGLYLYWSTPDLHDNVIAGNYATRGAGISALMYSAADIRGNIIRDNLGTGVYLSGSPAQLVNNRVEDNQGSGVECYLSDARLIGNLIAGNQAVRGGGVAITGSDPWLTNNTIAGNDAGQGGGVYATFHFVGIIVPSLPVLTNNIVYGNTGATGAQVFMNTNCVATARHCDVQDLAGGGVSGTMTLLEGNIDLPPVWTGTDPHAYALAEGSPCRNAGTPDCSGLDLPAHDLQGHDRICDGCVDMGAYEYAGGVPVPDGAPLLAADLLPAYPNPFNPRVTLRFRLTAAGPARCEVFDAGGRSVAVVWDAPAPAGETSVVWDGADSRGRPAPSGTYFARLTAGRVVRTGALTLVR